MNAFLLKIVEGLPRDDARSATASLHVFVPSMFPRWIPNSRRCFSIHVRQVVRKRSRSSAGARCNSTNFGDQSPFCKMLGADRTTCLGDCR